MRSVNAYRRRYASLSGRWKAWRCQSISTPSQSASIHASRMRSRAYSRTSGIAMFHDVTAQRGALPMPSTHSGWSLRNCVSSGRTVCAISSGASGKALRAESDQKWLSFMRMATYTSMPRSCPRRTMSPYRSSPRSNMARTLSALRNSFTEPYGRSRGSTTDSRLSEGHLACSAPTHQRRAPTCVSFNGSYILSSSSSTRWGYSDLPRNVPS